MNKNCVPYCSKCRATCSANRYLSKYRNIRGQIPQPCLRHLSATATCVAYHTYRYSKQAETGSISKTRAISLNEPVFLRSCRVIRLQDHPMFRQEALRVYEQSKI